MEKKSYESFLDYEVTNQDNGIEVHFCEPLDTKGEKSNMSDEDSQIFLTLCFVSEEDSNEMYNDVYKASGILKIFSSRAEYAGLKIDKKSSIMISVLCETPGEAVMYVYYLLYKAKQLGLKNGITFNDLGEKIFPFGFFTKKTLDFYWDEQKVKKNTESSGSDNLLDYKTASMSLVNE
jgi:hypothetical protein